MKTHERLAKLLVDRGALDLAEAHRRLASQPLQLVLGPEAASSETMQIAALLAADTGRRAFPAGVRTILVADGPGLAAWTSGRTLEGSLLELDARRTDTIDDLPTVVIGNPVIETLPQIAVRAVARGWAGGAVDLRRQPPDWRPGTLGAATAAAVAVSEIFGAVHGLSPRAGRRAVGLSAWMHGRPWTASESVGPPLAELPGALWLLGLGHLGQAYAWILRALPFAEASDVEVVLQDFDLIEDENFATQLLSDRHEVGRRKTRVVADALELRGMRTRLVERRFDGHQHRQANEPTCALIGLDDDEPRRLLSGAGWRQVVNAGLGGRADNFTQIVVRRVGRDSQQVFAETDEDDHAARLLENVPAYRALADADACGAVLAAGRAVGTSFVGAVAAVMAFAELLRPLHQGAVNGTWQANLRSLDAVSAHVHAGTPHDAPDVAVSARALAELDGETG